MRDLHDITVVRGIVHQVAPRQRRLVLSQLELVLADDDPISGFLSSHVASSLKDPQARAAKFVAMGPERASGICDRLLTTTPDLVELSQKLVTLLYQVTSGDERVSDGTVALLLCDGTRQTGTRERFAALLKLDPSNAFRTVEHDDDQGRKVLKLELEPDILPSAKERLQKCVFVRAEDPAAEYRMLLLDRQGAEGIAQFFVAKFMGAELILDAEERTRRLYRSLREARNNVAPQLNAADLSALDQVIQGAVAAGAVNIDELVSTLPVPVTIRDEIDRAVSEALPDREFELDRTIADQLVKRVSFVGDNGLKLSVLADFYDDMVTVEDEEGPEPRKRRITITTQQWSEQ